MKTILVFSFLWLYSMTVFAADENVEHWTQVESHKFGLWDSLFRSQGLANDGQGNFWYSSRVSLLKTHSKWSASELMNFIPFPAALLKIGDNHIGDIDFIGGKLIVPIEDGPKYNHPFIGVFDAETLKIEKYVGVPVDWQIDGVPWAAVDAVNGHVLSSQYHNTTKINVYDLSTLAPVLQIPMSQELDAIQGAKVLDGNLYMTTNGAKDSGGHDGHGFSIYKMNLSTGVIVQVARFDDDVVEVEGLTFVPNETGFDLYALTVVGAGLNKRTALCVFKRD